MMRLLRRLATVLVVAAAVVAVAAFGLHEQEAAGSAPNLPPTANGYLGVYAPGMPHSTAGLTGFDRRPRRSSNVAVYYSGWLEPFQSRFAAQGVRPRGGDAGADRPARASAWPRSPEGRYDGYLASYAQAVRQIRPPGDRQLRP